MVTRVSARTVDAATLDGLVEIAREAGAAILEYYTPREGGINPAPTGSMAGMNPAPTGFGVQWKEDRSPVTAADLASHATIVAALGGLFPDTPIVSEEGWVPDLEAQRGLARFWLVDPLDGTKEFLARNGEFTVNIALIERDEPVAGVVCAPALDLVYFAAAGLGAWKCASRGGPRVRLASSPPQPGQALIVVESRSHPSADLEAWLATVPVARRVAVGSSLKFCWLADGTADVYPRFGPTMEWDVAAGDCVFRCSGRDRPRRSPLRYNKPGLRNGAFVIGLDEQQDDSRGS